MNAEEPNDDYDAQAAEAARKANIEELNAVMPQALEERVRVLEEKLEQAKWDAIAYKTGDHPWVPLGVREDGFLWTILARSGDYQRPGFDWSGEPFGRFRSQHDAQRVADALNEAEHDIRELRALLSPAAATEGGEGA